MPLLLPAQLAGYLHNTTGTGVEHSDANLYNYYYYISFFVSSFVGQNEEGRFQGYFGCMYGINTRANGIRGTTASVFRPLNDY